MNLRDLHYVLAVADLRHFGRAARRCSVTQPTLSGQILRLEETLGVQLFERVNRTVRLTAPGEKIIEVAREIIDAERRIFELAHVSRDEFGGRFRIGAFPTLASYIFPGFVQHVRQRLPDLNLILREEKSADLMENLIRGELDAALLALPIDNKKLVSEVLFEDPFFLAVPAAHPLSKERTINRALGVSGEMLLLEEGHCLRDQTMDFCEAQGAGQYHDFRATSLETLRQMVKAGTGITIMPEIAIERNVQDITYIPFESPSPSRTIALVWRRSYPNVNLVEKVVECVKESRC